MRKLIIVAAAFAIAAPAVAQVQAPQAVPTAKDAKPKMICEKEEDTGTRLGGRKVCHTRAEWDQMRLDARQEVERDQRQNTSTGIPAG